MRQLTFNYMSTANFEVGDEVKEEPTLEKKVAKKGVLTGKSTGKAGGKLSFMPSGNESDKTSGSRVDNIRRDFEPKKAGDKGKDVDLTRVHGMM